MYNENLKLHEKRHFWWAVFRVVGYLKMWSIGIFLCKKKNNLYLYVDSKTIHLSFCPRHIKNAGGKNLKMLLFTFLFFIVLKQSFTLYIQLKNRFFYLIRLFQERKKGVSLQKRGLKKESVTHFYLLFVKKPLYISYILCWYRQ